MEGEDGKVGGGVALSCLGGLEELGVVVVVVVSPRRARAQARSARKRNGTQRPAGVGEGVGVGRKGSAPRLAAGQKKVRARGRGAQAHRPCLGQKRRERHGTGLLLFQAWRPARGWLIGGLSSCGAY